MPRRRCRCGPMPSTRFRGLRRRPARGGGSRFPCSTRPCSSRSSTSPTTSSTRRATWTTPPTARRRSGSRARAATRPRSSSRPRRSTSCRRSSAAARCCRRRAPTSTPSCSTASCSTGWTAEKGRSRMGKQDLEIARTVTLKPIQDVAATVGLSPAELEPFGHYKAKVAWSAIERRRAEPDGALVLVTAMTPTPAGEGKSTTTVGLADGLRRVGKRAVVALREPSLGPVFGMKGGATGGGRAQLAPMEDINLHFTGDMHAIGSAHNLLAAMVDNHLSQANTLGLDTRRILWKRVVDMNDRALRNIVLGLGGPAHGVPRESGFEITVASEVMAILCLSADLQDFKSRVERVVVAEKADGSLITAAQLKAAGAMAVLMKGAIKPNLVQTLEGTPALVHGGPFGNIAHGCNSVIATRLALKLGEVVVTEAGFA